MSGGRFNYLAFRDPEELLNRLGDLLDMEEALVDTGYADDAARETRSIRLLICALVDQLGAHKERLDPVWKAMEWWHSGDIEEEDFKKVLEEYRGRK